MKKFITSLFFFIIILNNSFGDNKSNDNIVSKISSTKIKIGEIVLLQIKVKDLKNVKILWEEMNTSSNKLEIISKKDFMKDNDYNFEIEFTFYESGLFKNIDFTIPMSSADGKILYLTSDKYDINVINPLTDEEIKNIKNTEDPSKIKLKDEKEQANMPFKISFYLIIILVILSLIIIGAILYFFIYKKMMKEKNGVLSKKLPPYEEFLANMAKIIFEKNDDRFAIEKKLSMLTETLKQLIYDEFSFNAPSETTIELITTLRQKKFNNDLIANINMLFNKIDMIKFAKADFVFDELNDFVRKINELGFEIHSYKISIIEKENINNQQKDLNIK